VTKFIERIKIVSGSNLWPIAHLNHDDAGTSNGTDEFIRWRSRARSDTSR